jgi:hypothetical protein
MTRHGLNPRPPGRGARQFNYFVEKLPNYTKGYQQAKKIFERDLAGPGQRRPRKRPA